MGIEFIIFYYITFVRIVKYRRPHSFSLLPNSTHSTNQQISFFTNCGRGKKRDRFFVQNSANAFNFDFG